MGSERPMTDMGLYSSVNNEVFIDGIAHTLELLKGGTFLIGGERAVMDGGIGLGLLLKAGQIIAHAILLCFGDIAIRPLLIKENP